MESTAQYWRPVWEALELHWRPKCRTREGASPICGTLHLAQAQSNRGAGGRKKDFPDAERLVKRVGGELTVVPEKPERIRLAADAAWPKSALSPGFQSGRGDAWRSIGS